MLLMSVVYKITNDHKKYCEETDWIRWMTRLISLTGVIMLIMDYENTKTLANAFIIGYAAATLHDLANQRKNKTS